ncbi:hypothetical protein PM033_17705, partial [Halorubrum ezzemoulense]|uniref:hypothetical protein n=1 Tax=Halorubrum ezzemoulense TaxID=337243 RepID=UPI002330CE29
LIGDKLVSTPRLIGLLLAFMFEGTLNSGNDLLAVAGHGGTEVGPIRLYNGVVIAAGLDIEDLLELAIEFEINDLQHEGVDVRLKEVVIVEQERRRGDFAGDDPRWALIEVLVVVGATNATSTERRN